MSGLIINEIPAWWTEEHGETVAPLLGAALAEAGYPVSIVHRNPGSPGPYVQIPRPVFNKARSLIFQRFGVPFEWCPDCPDDWFSARGRHAHIDGGDAS